MLSFAKRPASVTESNPMVLQIGFQMVLMLSIQRMGGLALRRLSIRGHPFDMSIAGNLFCTNSADDEKGKMRVFLMAGFLILIRDTNCRGKISLPYLE